MHHPQSPINRWTKLRCKTTNKAFDVFIAPNGSTFLSTEDVACYVDVMFGLYPGIESFLLQLQELPCTKEIVIENLSDVRNSIQNRYECLFKERKFLTASYLSKEKNVNIAGEFLETCEVLNTKHEQCPNLLQKDAITCPNDEISLTETCDNLPLFNNKDVEIDDCKYSFNTKKSHSHAKNNDDIFETISLSRTFFTFNDRRDSDDDDTRVIRSSADQLLSDSSEPKDFTKTVTKNEHDCGSSPLVKELNNNFVYSSNFKKKEVAKKVKRESLSPYFKTVQSSKGSGFIVNFFWSFFLVLICYFLVLL